MTRMPDAGDRSISELITDVFDRLSMLIRGEVALAQAEITAKARTAAIGIGLIAVAGLIVIAALVLLLVALAAALVAAGLNDPLADLVAALVGLMASGALVAIGLKQLRADALTPKRTLFQLKKDVVTTKEHLS